MGNYIRQMDLGIKQNQQDRERILLEIKSMKDRKEILSWEEIASAIAYPKVMADNEFTGGNPDDFKLFHQAERIHKIYISQMEELFEELENAELQITKYKYVNRCISKLDVEAKEIIEKFVRNDLTYEKGAEIFHVSRSTLYRLQRKALGTLTDIYNRFDP